jgi:signal transduction histidine kinase
MNPSDKDRSRDRLDTVGFFASLITHRTRNRLATIRAALEVLEAGREADLSAELRATLVQQMNSVLDDFNLGADMVRCHFGMNETVSVREVADRALADFQPGAGREGILVSPAYGSADRALADRRLLRLALLNLLRNAADSMAGAERPRIALSTMTQNGWLHIDVEDNGPGVPVEMHDRLLLEPVAASEGGSGLGLTLCRDAMTVMGGSIHYLTPKGRAGGHFRLSLPLAP